MSKKEEFIKALDTIQKYLEIGNTKIDKDLRLNLEIEADGFQFSGDKFNPFPIYHVYSWDGIIENTTDFVDKIEEEVPEMFV